MVAPLRPSAARSVAVRSQASSSAKAAAASRQRAPRPQNAPGPLWVDHTCIDCDTCRWMAPSVFHRDGGQSAVSAQPAPGTAAETAALRAITACPTGSIHLEGESLPKDEAARKIKEGAAAFPFLFPEAAALGLEVYHLGYHSVDSFAGTPWLVRNPTTGVAAFIDSPRYSSQLQKAIEQKFGADKVKYMFLTHAHDVADHAKWAEKMGVQRVIHEMEAVPSRAITRQAGKGLDQCEVQLTGTGPWDPFNGELGANTKLIHQEGHTPGGICMHFQPDGSSAAVAFTGDHIGGWEDTHRLGCFTQYDSQPLAIHAAALRKWADDSTAAAVKLVLPGHGRWCAVKDFPSELRSVADELEA